MGGVDRQSIVPRRPAKPKGKPGARKLAVAKYMKCARLSAAAAALLAAGMVAAMALGGMPGILMVASIGCSVASAIVAWRAATWIADVGGSGKREPRGRANRPVRVAGKPRKEPPASRHGAPMREIKNVYKMGGE